jgi:hypothetical protein
MRFRPIPLGRLRIGVLSLVVLVASLAPATASTVDAAFTGSATATTSFTSYSLAAPTGLGASGTSTVSLSWTATSSGLASGTRVFRGTASGGPYTQIAQIAGLATTSTTDSPGAGTFYYVVKAYYNGNGANWTSVASNEASISILPAFVQSVGTTSCGATTQTVTVPAGGVPAGHTLIVRVGNRSTNTGAITATDSRGNTYTVDADVASTLARSVVLSAYIATPLLQNDTITVTQPSATSSSMAVAEFSGIASSNRVNASGSATGNGGSPSVNLTTTNATDMIYGALATQGNPAVTNPAPWSTHANLNISCGGAPGATTNSGAYQVVSSTGTYTYTPTIGTVQDWAATIVAYKAG